MKRGKKRCLIMVVAMVGLLSINMVPLYAQEDDIEYYFRIQANHGNTYSNKRFRQTSNNSNKWKVDFQYSGEGAGTITTYWLAKFNASHDIVSNTHRIKQGSGPKYYSTYDGADKTDVCLGAENNNNSGNTYIVSGYWDEETK